MKFIILSLSLLLFFSGCDLLKSDEEKAAEVALEKEKVSKKQELEKLKIDNVAAQHNAELEMQKSLALIEKEKEVEKKRLELALKENSLKMEKEKTLAKLQHDQMIHEQQNYLKFQQYGFALLGLIIVILAFFIYYYFKKRREDKLRAYNDNLQKYFHHKESDARIKIAEKLLDTIATGKLNKDQENRLISVFNGEKSSANGNKPLDFSEQVHEYEEVEILESPSEKN